MHNFQHAVVRFLVATVVLSATANAQFDIPGFGSFGGDGGGTKAEFEAEFKATADGRAGELSVTAILGPGWHIYSMVVRSRLAMARRRVSTWLISAKSRRST